MAGAPEDERAGPGRRPAKARRASPGLELPLHPFLFALASVVAYLASGREQATLGDAAPALVGVFLTAGILYLVVALLRRRFDAATAIIASIWVVGGLYYWRLFGSLNRWLDGGYPMVKSLPVVLVLLLVLSVVVWRLARWLRPLHIGLNFMAAVMLVLPAWTAGAYAWTHRAALEAYDAERAAAEMPVIDDAGPTATAAGERAPDIYYFIFDRYAREDILSRDFDVDNHEIGDFLEDRGFYLARGSNSNYLKTGPSIASTFYMDYLDNLGDDPNVTGGNWHPTFAMLRDHRVGRFLKARGYDYLQYGSWWVGTHNASLADENHPHGFSEFGMIYLRSTMLRPIFHVLPDTQLTMRLDWDNAQCQRVGNQLRELKALGDRDKPVFVFAHILVPHGPYAFSREGECLSEKVSADRGGRQGYIDQIAYASKMIRDMVASLQSHERKPVIIIQADEGPFPKRDYSVPWQDAPAEELRIKTSILNAYYFPDGDYSRLYEDITPVNSFRATFDTIFGVDLPLLPDRIYAFPTDRNLYDYHDVTEKVRSEPEEGETMSQHAPMDIAD